MDTWTAELSTLSANVDLLKELVAQFLGQNAKAEGTPSKNGTGTEENGRSESAIALLILAVLQRADGLSDRQIAREVSCSKTTVARWRKYYQDKGVLAFESNQQFQD